MSVCLSIYQINTATFHRLASHQKCFIKGTQIKYLQTSKTFITFTGKLHIFKSFCSPWHFVVVHSIVARNVTHYNIKVVIFINLSIRTDWVIFNGNIVIGESEVTGLKRVTNQISSYCTNFCKGTSHWMTFRSDVSDLITWFHWGWNLQQASTVLGTIFL